MTDPTKIFIYVNDEKTSLAAYLAMDPKTVKTVDAIGCTALTELRADAAETVNASGCTALRSHKIIHGGTDKRGYGFSAINCRGAWRIVAGCRNFTPEQAIAHWSSPGKSAECLALAKELIAKIDEQAKSE